MIVCVLRRIIRTLRLRFIKYIIKIVLELMCLYLFLILFLRKCRLIRKDAFLKRIRSAIEGAGVLFVKMAQNASLMDDLLGNEVVQELKHLHNNVIPEYIPIELSTVEISDPKPIACGSVAQVYRGRLLDDDRPVAIKLLRPSVIRQCRILYWMKRLVLPILPVLPALRIRLKSYINTTIDQTAFTKERDMMELFRRLQSNVKIPMTHDALCNDKCLVMDFIDPLTSVYDITESDRESFCEKLSEIASEMMFKIGHVHCDMHPGNVFWDTKEKRVILFDFAYTYQLDDKVTSSMTKFYTAVALKRVRDATEAFGILTYPNFKDKMKHEDYMEMIDREMSLLIDGKQSIQATTQNMYKITTSPMFRHLPDLECHSDGLNIEAFTMQVANLCRIVCPDYNIFESICKYNMKHIFNIRSDDMMTDELYLDSDITPFEFDVEMDDCPEIHLVSHNWPEDVQEVHQGLLQR